MTETVKELQSRLDAMEKRARLAEEREESAHVHLERWHAVYEAAWARTGDILDKEDPAHKAVDRLASLLKVLIDHYEKKPSQKLIDRALEVVEALGTSETDPDSGIRMQLTDYSKMLRAIVVARALEDAVEGRLKG